MFRFSPIIGFGLSIVVGVPSAFAEQWLESGIQKNLDGDFNGAMLDFERHLNDFPNNARAYLGICNAKSFLGRHKDAIKDCTKAIELDPSAAALHLPL